MDPSVIDDETLGGYLSESLPPEGMARVEKGLRESADLRARLEDVRNGRADQGTHTLGAIWRRMRLSCANRQELGSYLLEALDPEHADYLKFHIEVIGCPFCGANLADLRAKNELTLPAAQTRSKRIYHSSRHLLSGEG